MKFKFEFSFEFAFEKVIYNEIRFKNDEACVIGFLEIIKINNVEEIKRVLKSKSFLLMINFDNNLRVDCFKIKMKSA